MLSGVFTGKPKQDISYAGGRFIFASQCSYKYVSASLPRLNGGAIHHYASSWINKLGRAVGKYVSSLLDGLWEARCWPEVYIVDAVPRQRSLSWCAIDCVRCQEPSQAWSLISYCGNVTQIHQIAASCYHSLRSTHRMAKRAV